LFIIESVFASLTTSQFLGRIFVAHCRICICEPYDCSFYVISCCLSTLYLRASRHCFDCSLRQVRLEAQRTFFKLYFFNLRLEKMESRAIKAGGMWCFYCIWPLFLKDVCWN